MTSETMICHYCGEPFEMAWLGRYGWREIYGPRHLNTFVETHRPRTSDDVWEEQG